MLSLSSCSVLRKDRAVSVSENITELHSENVFQLMMDVDAVPDFNPDEGGGMVDFGGELESVKFWVALIIGSWYLVGFSKGLR